MSQPSSSHILKTPYYEEIDTSPEVLSIKGADNVVENYQPYDLFCLRTRLYPYLDVGEDIQFVKETLDARRTITIRILNGGQEVQLNMVRLSLLQDRINMICDDTNASKMKGKRAYCLLYRSSSHQNVPPRGDFNRRLVSNEYHRIMLPLLNIDKLCSQKNSDIKIVDGDIFIRLDEGFDEDSYQNVHTKLNVAIYQELTRAYERGYLPCSKEFAEKWDMTCLPEHQRVFWKEIASPNWNYPSFIPKKINFLVDRYLDKPLDIVVPQKKSFYHMVASYIQPVLFVAGCLRIFPDNMKSVRKTFAILHYIHESDYSSLNIETTQWPVLPEDIPEKCVVYTIDDSLFPIVLSCQI